MDGYLYALFCHLPQSWILLSIKMMTQQTWSYVRLQLLFHPIQGHGAGFQHTSQIHTLPKTTLRGRLETAVLCLLLICSAGKPTVCQKTSWGCDTPGFKP